MSSDEWLGEGVETLLECIEALSGAGVAGFEFVHPGFEGGDLGVLLGAEFTEGLDGNGLKAGETDAEESARAGLDPFGENFLDVLGDESGLSAFAIGLVFEVEGDAFEFQQAVERA